MFSVRNCGKTLVSRTQGTKIATEELKGRVLEAPAFLGVSLHFCLQQNGGRGEEQKQTDSDHIFFWGNESGNQRKKQPEGVLEDEKLCL